ncbi:methylenetetrahydrofolate reductase [NAD(P)H] [Candidatus Zinderia endosymbiont of Aphrophora alni]|uniref:methylenetetrahydrofolate reductase [NAD(P)H] n=1 Tax=Candidatus Zinderia endosymbiont of Aphrophora alni TaxID=3077951 RepID=UPI0030D5B933
MLLKKFSVEFFPPKTIEGINNLRFTMNKLSKLNPTFFSVTHGTCNNTQYGTFNTVLEIFKNGYNVVPHISCIGNTKNTLKSIIYQYKSMGIKDIVVLRGDIIKKYKEKKNLNNFNYAEELIKFIKFNTGNWFNIKVAAYPEKHFETNSFFKDIYYFIKKVRLGVNSAITQYFYNIDAYFNFVDNIQKLGIYIPIIPGIMPIISYSQLKRFSNICGSEIPKWIHLKLLDYKNDINSIKSFGIDLITEMCQKLLENGVSKLHFYTLNNPYATIKICKNLNFY